MHQIYSQIISLVKSNISSADDSRIQFSDPNYKPVDFDKNNFHKIEIMGNKKIALIDGGS